MKFRGSHARGSHVTLTQEQSSQRKGNRYSVMVEVRVPRIINEAFGAIETQLKRTVARRRGDAKEHAEGRPAAGTA